MVTRGVDSQTSRCTCNSPTNFLHASVGSWTLRSHAPEAALGEVKELPSLGSYKLASRDISYCIMPSIPGEEEPLNSALAHKDQLILTMHCT